MPRVTWKLTKRRIRKPLKRRVRSEIVEVRGETFVLAMRQLNEGLTSHFYYLTSVSCYSL